MKSIVSLKDVVVTINGDELLHNISFDVPPKTAFGFLGPNGAGKTTTMKTILGLLTPEYGEVQVFGGSTRESHIRSRIGFMPENTYLYKHLSAYEFLDFNASFFEMSKQEKEERISTLLEQV